MSDLDQHSADDLKKVGLDEGQISFLGFGDDSWSCCLTEDGL